jgi:hypothetical protein
VVSVLPLFQQIVSELLLSQHIPYPTYSPNALCLNAFGSAVVGAYIQLHYMSKTVKDLANLVIDPSSILTSSTNEKSLKEKASIQLALTLDNMESKESSRALGKIS